MRVRLPAEARRDVDEIGRFLRVHDPVAAQRVRAAIEAGLDSLATFPRAGRDLGGRLRRLALPRFPYLIHDRLDASGDAVQILTIRHAARRSP